MDTKGINEKMIILFIVVAMLMSATCLNGENISSSKYNGKKTLTRSSLDRDSCTKYCTMTDTTQITLRSELLFQIKDSVAVLRDRIQKELGNLLNLVRLLILGV